LQRAQRARESLAREKMPWTDVLAELLAASLASATGDASRAEQALQRAIEFADSAEMSLHAAAARYRLGLLLGGATGDSVVKAAEEVMRARGVRVPARYARMLVPGDWPSIDPSE
jgi:hypothetical protein